MKLDADKWVVNAEKRMYSQKRQVWLPEISCFHITLRVLSLPQKIKILYHLKKCAVGILYFINILFGFYIIILLTYYLHCEVLSANRL
jgi:hypothetical protein